MQISLNKSVLVMVLAQLSQRTTILAIVNAAALLTSLHLSAEKQEAVATLLSCIDAVALAVVQERTTPAVVVSDIAVVDNKAPVTVVQPSKNTESTS